MYKGLPLGAARRWVACAHILEALDDRCLATAVLSEADKYFQNKIDLCPVCPVCAQISADPRSFKSEMINWVHEDIDFSQSFVGWRTANIRLHW